MAAIIKRSLASLCSKPQKLTDVVLVGRDYIGPKNLTSIELKSLIWTAMDLKYLSKQRSFNVSCVEDARVTLLMDNTSLNIQVPINNAARMLKSSLSVVQDIQWKRDPCLEDYGRMLSTCSDIVFCGVKEQDKIEDIADGCNVPVVAIQTGDFSLVKVLADVMTLQLHYEYVKNLKFAYIGPAGPLLNTYLCVLPMFRIDIKYCIMKDLQSANNKVILNEGLKHAQKYNTELHECVSLAKTMYRSDVIGTCRHDNLEGIKLKDMEQAGLNWSLLYNLPRGESDIENKLFKHDNNLVWKSLENSTWIYAALILRFLTGYNHAIEEPHFDRMD